MPKTFGYKYKCFLGAAQGRLPKGDIMIWMPWLALTTPYSGMCWGNSLGDRKDNGGRFVNFCNFHRLVINRTLFEDRTYHNVSLVSIDRYYTSNQIDHFAISSGFKSCLLDVHNKRGAGLERNHDLKVAYVHLRVTSATSCRVGELWQSMHSNGIKPLGATVFPQCYLSLHLQLLQIC